MTKAKNPDEPRPRPRGGHGRPLTPQEIEAWHTVTQTVKPAKGRKPPPSPPPSKAPAAPEKAKAEKAKAVKAKAEKIKPLAARTERTGPRTPSVPRRRIAVPAIEARLLRALKRGQVTVEASIDLHGKTQEAAHRQLDAFITRARRGGFRCVLIVTGKGAGGGARAGDRSGSGVAGEERGVLRRAVPAWLALPPLADHVVGLAQAGPRHGGAGALYIVLRTKARR